MTTPGHGTRRHRDVDDLVRGAFHDDLPPQVEALLDRSIERFLAKGTLARRRPGASSFAFVREAAERIGASGLGRALVPVASTLLFAAGIVSLVAGHRNAFAWSFSRINLSISFSEAVRGASSMSCAPMAGAPLASPDDLADAIYRGWTLVRVEPTHGNGTRAVFRSRSDEVMYELVVEGGTWLPREIRRIQRPDEAPEIARCEWGTLQGGETHSSPRSSP